jgi:hypothetical protein
MFGEGLIEKKMFSLCLGKHGGSLIVGGYNEDLFITSEDVRDPHLFWIPMRSEATLSFHADIKTIHVNLKYLILNIAWQKRNTI